MLTVPAASNKAGLAALNAAIDRERIGAIAVTERQGGPFTTEDLWLLETTATWVEEQVYDDINDNRQYLPVSQIYAPNIPLDAFSRNAGFQIIRPRKGYTKREALRDQINSAINVVSASTCPAPAPSPSLRAGG